MEYFVRHYPRKTLVNQRKNRLSAVLSQEKIGIFAVSTYNTDYILTKEENFENALAALSRAGYEVIR